MVQQRRLQAAAREELLQRLRRIQAQAMAPDPFGAGTIRSATSLADVPRQLGEQALRGVGDLLTNATPLGIPIRLGAGLSGLAADAPQLRNLLGEVLTAPLGPNQPIASGLAELEALLGAGQTPGPSNPAPAGYHRMPDGSLMADSAAMAVGQAPMGAPSAATLPPTPPGGYQTPAGFTGGVGQITNPAVPEGTGTINGQPATSIQPYQTPPNARHGDALPVTSAGGYLPPPNARHGDNLPATAVRSLGVMPPAGLTTPSTSLTAPGQLTDGLSANAIEAIQGNPALYADMLNRQRGRIPGQDIWANKERVDVKALQELYPLFETDTNRADDSEYLGYLRGGLEGRRTPGGRMPFREALQAKLGDEAGSAEVLQALGIPMALQPDQVDEVANRAGLLVGRVQLQAGRFPAMAQARADRVREEVLRQYEISLQSGEAFGQPQIAAIIRTLA